MIAPDRLEVFAPAFRGHEKLPPCASVWVGGASVRWLITRRREQDFRVCGLVDYPLGVAKPMVRQVQATSLAKDGADDVAVAFRLRSVAQQQVREVCAELVDVIAMCREVSSETQVKLVPVETPGVDAAWCRTICGLARTCGADAVATGTGFDPRLAATGEYVELLKRHAEGLQVLAVGGIDTVQRAMSLMSRGADRVVVDAKTSTHWFLEATSPDIEDPL